MYVAVIAVTVFACKVGCVAECSVYKINVDEAYLCSAYCKLPVSERSV